MTLGELAKRIGARLVVAESSQSEVIIERCARLCDAGKGEVSFFVNPRYVDQLSKTEAEAVIVGPEVEYKGSALLVADDPYYAFREAMVALHGFKRHMGFVEGSDEVVVHERSFVDSTAKIGEGTVIHAFAVVCEGAIIGRKCVIYPHTFIGPGVRLGDECAIFSNVAIYDGCELGDRVVLHGGTVIGQDGLGYAPHDGKHWKIPQVGNVVIGDDVEMGANCAVDCATMGSTIIGEGTKFSDGVTIGHGCHIGKHNLFVGQVGVAGSVITGDYVVMGGQVGVAGHLRIGDRVQIAADSGVMTDIPDDSQYGGTPAMPLTEAKRIHLHSVRLPSLVARVKKIEREKKNSENDNDQ